VIAHIRSSALGPTAAVWGKEDTFFHTLQYWGGELFESFFYPPILAIFLSLVVVGIVLWRRGIGEADGNPRRSDFRGAALVSAVQIALTLTVFSFGSNRIDRFLLPLWPCVALLIGWAVDEIRQPGVKKMIQAAFLAQLLIVHGGMFKLVPVKFAPSYYVLPLQRDLKKTRVLEEVINRTCVERRQERYRVVVAIDPTMWGDWFAPVPAGYAAAKRYGLEAPCGFDYAGGGFFGASLADTWRLLATTPPQYLLINDPSRYPLSPSVLNRSLTPDNHARLLELLRTDGLFEEQPPLGVDPGILVFKRRSPGGSEAH
jgi:hypothetical protein